MLKFRFLLVVMLLLSVHLKAQTTYGNEWINPNQKYLKIKINAEGLYGISVNDVLQSNLISQGIDPNKFRLYNKGVEVPLFITGVDDSNFNGDDKIIFYGIPNDSSLDRPLYSNTDNIPNEKVSLFESENYYFLTYNPNNIDGLRYQKPSISNQNLTPETFVVYNTRLNFSENYYPGEYILDVMSLSEYIEGEGYLSSPISKGGSIIHNVNTSNFVNTTEFTSKLSVYVAGRSNASSSDSKGNNHHFRVTNSSSIILDTIYKGYKTVRRTVPISLGSITTPITLSSVDDLGAVTDFQAVGYLGIEYPRNLDLNNSVKALNFFLDNSKTTSLLSFTNNSISQPILLDLTSNKYFDGTVINNNLQFTVDNNKSIKQYYLGSKAELKSVVLESVTFKNFQPTDIKSFLIISNKKLETGTNSYLDYNNNVRGIPSAVAFVGDLYNEFYFGFQHPLAIKNFCSWALSKSTIKPEYLLLLGKGYEMAKQNSQINLVPTYGFPASDNMLTSGIISNTTEPALATGRVPAKNNLELENYLNKLKVYEQLPDSLWRKKLIHIAGGKTSSESFSFKNYLKSLSNSAKEEYFGAYAVNFNKNVSDPVTESLTDLIVNETRRGAALVSFLGHGSTTLTETSLGNSVTINNSNKPTVYLVNGCSTGNAFTESTSYGEQFILQKDNGAVGWIGTTSEGVASYLYSFSTNFYKNWFNTFYSKSISFGIKEGIKTATNQSDKLSLAHSRQYVFLGDPYLKYMSPKLPDYTLESNSIYLFPSDQNASQEKLKFKLIINNLGKTFNDSLEVRIKRSLPGNIEITKTVKIRPIFSKDTLSLEFDNLTYKVAGENKISILIDPENKIQEINKTNNTSTSTFFLRGNNVNTLFPLDNSIVNNQVSLEAQPDNLLTKNAVYMFELDTVSSFDSNFKLSSGSIVDTGIFPKWQPSFTPINNKVYFWRVKILNEDANLDNWKTASFTYIENSSSGFNISNKSQIFADQIKTEYINLDNGKFKFGNLVLNAAILTRGDDAPSNSSDRRLRVNDLSVSWLPPERNGITMVSYSDKDYGAVFSYPSPYNSTDGPKPINGYVGQFYWDTNTATDLDSMLVYLNNIPDGYYVIGFNNLNLTMNQLPPNIKQALRDIGLAKFESVGFGEPYMFFGRKGSSAGSALEITADYSSSIPPKLQTLIYAHDIVSSNDNGSITSPKIGPSAKWENAEISFSERNSDELNYYVIGVKKDGTESQILSGINKSINLSGINALDYPYIRLKSSIKNKELKTVPSLNHWRAAYTPLPELSFNPDVKNDFHEETISIGDSLKLSLGISNLFSQNSNNVKITSTIRKQDNSTIQRVYDLPAIENNKTTEFVLKESTIGLTGKNNIKLSLENTTFGDNYNFNNIIDYNFEVISDDKPPLLDVAFDGKRIINREIVSATPTIEISSVDENKFLLQSDTNSLNIYLKKENDNNFVRVNFSDGKLNVVETGSSLNNRLVIRYLPGKLEDGIYSLRVSTKDLISGSSSQRELLTDFEIINESSISNFYPYPNPVVNSMRFVFTLTGSSVPDKIKIQILSQTGKIVREISKEELGMLRIGNNISDFVWDCTDQFGDRLANGVYFYKVFVEDSSDNFKHRFTQGDKNFKNNIGKIYLIK